METKMSVGIKFVYTRFRFVLRARLASSKYQRQKCGAGEAMRREHGATGAGYDDKDMSSSIASVWTV
jgi:hypothetical protein